MTTTPTTTALDFHNRAFRAREALRSMIDSLVYTPPEMQERRYFETVAAVMNILDPDGRCADAAVSAQESALASLTPETATPGTVRPDPASQTPTGPQGATPDPLAQLASAQRPSERRDPSPHLRAVLAALEERGWRAWLDDLGMAGHVVRVTDLKAGNPGRSVTLGCGEGKYADVDWTWNDPRLLDGRDRVLVAIGRSDVGSSLSLTMDCTYDVDFSTALPWWPTHLIAKRAVTLVRAAWDLPVDVEGVWA